MPWPVRMVLDLGLAPAAFAVLLSGGVNALVASLVSLVVQLAWAVPEFARTRTVNAMTVVIVAGVVAGGLLTFWAGSAELAVAKDSFYTAVFGIAMLGSLLARRPLMVRLVEPFATKDGDPVLRQRWDAGWTSPFFRRSMRVMTSVWGVGLLVEALFRIILLVALPAKVVADLSPFLTIAIVGSLMTWTAAYGQRSGARRDALEDATAPATTTKGPRA